MAILRALREPESLTIPVKGVLPMLRKTLNACAGAAQMIHLFGEPLVQWPRASQMQHDTLGWMSQALDLVFDKLIYNFQRQIGYILVGLIGVYDVMMTEIHGKLDMCIQSFIYSDTYEVSVKNYTVHMTALAHSIVAIYKKSGEVAQITDIHVEEANQNALIAIEVTLQTIMDIMSAVLKALNEYIMVRFDEDSEGLKTMAKTLVAALRPDGGIIVSKIPVVQRKSETTGFVGQFVHALLKLTGEVQSGIIDGSYPASYSSYNGHRWDSIESFTCLQDVTRRLCATATLCLKETILSTV